MCYFTFRKDLLLKKASMCTQMQLILVLRNLKKKKSLMKAINQQKRGKSGAFLKTRLCATLEFPACTMLQLGQIRPVSADEAAAAPAAAARRHASVVAKTPPSKAPAAKTGALHARAFSSTCRPPKSMLSNVLKRL